jgi:hypothetical protein
VRGVDVLYTRRAEQQAQQLRQPARRCLDQVLDDLAYRGCAALDYRLSGPSGLERLCVKHLSGPGQLRVITAFSSRTTAWIVLIGPHNRDPGTDVYAELYQLAGVSIPDIGRRRKPPCCQEDGTPPVDEVIDGMVERATALRRSRL